jgi:Flp pilus assembly CpaF family ATPase
MASDPGEKPKIRVPRPRAAGESAFASGAEPAISSSIPALGDDEEKTDPGIVGDDDEKTDPKLDISALDEEEEKTDPGLEIPTAALAQPSAPARPPSGRPLSVALAPGAPAAPFASGGAPAPVPPAPAAAARTTVRMPELGPLDTFMKDPTVTEIMVNDVRNVMIERDGKMQFSGFAFQTVDELNRITRNILDVSGRILSPDQPYVDTMMPDGSRVNIVAPPLTITGPCITIRKFPSRRLGIDDLMSSGALDRRIAYFLNICVVARLNILVCGGTGSGKTTLLNVLSTFIPKTERLVTIEDTPELAISHFNSVRLQTKPQGPTSQPVTARDLVANALRMRPDRIIVGECRRSEAFDMLQAMNTGHAGSMTTIHANSPRDGLARLETLCMTSGVELPLSAIRRQIQSALDLIVQIKRFRSGKRRITAITEVTGMEGETITLQDIFAFESASHDLSHSDDGIFKATGLVPTFVDRLREQGFELPRNYFG